MFDILIIGAGHAGVEAAWIAHQHGLQVGMVTLPGIDIASTPCNPAIGGVGKGQVVRELDALGGLMGRIADLAGIQYRTLNESKGFAVHSTRAQVDKEKYSFYANKIISEETNIEIIRARVDGVSKEDYFSVALDTGEVLTSTRIIVTAGTFLAGKTHIGDEVKSGGRYDQQSSGAALDIFSGIKTNKKRFKTGTPPRLDKNTINYELMEVQPSDNETRNFHFAHSEHERNLKQIDCYITWTNEETHNLIDGSKERSPMYNGQISAIGPRYCPSIEDKIFRYPDRKRHHLFIEKEGLNIDTVYPNGLSTSLPKDIQEKILKTVPALAESRIINYGYAVEYDVIETRSLNRELEYVEIPGLYFAGQINGTSGYEEAAAQGFIAGLSAARKSLNEESIYFSRRDSYIGVLIEDLVTNYREEPYRLFTARSENRLFIREDNNFERMYPYRRQFNLNLALDSFYKTYNTQRAALYSAIKKKHFAGNKKNKEFLKQFDVSLPDAGFFLEDILRMGHLNPVEFFKRYLETIGLSFPNYLIRTIAITIKYEGYIERSEREYKKVKKLDSKKINWNEISTSTNISTECRQLIEMVKPETFSELKNINGIRPATLAFVACNL